MALLYIENAKYEPANMISRTRAVAICLESISLDAQTDDLVSRVASKIDQKAQECYCQHIARQPSTSLLPLISFPFPITPSLPSHASHINTTTATNSTPTSPTITPLSFSTPNSPLARNSDSNQDILAIVEDLSAPRPETPATPASTHITNNINKNFNITSKEQALEYLVAWNYTTPSECIDICLISHILLQISAIHQMPMDTMDGIRVVAFLLEENNTNHITNGPTFLIKQRMEEVTRWLETNLDNVQEQMGNIMTVIEAIKTSMTKAVTSTPTPTPTPAMAMEPTITYTSIAQNAIRPEIAEVVAKDIDSDKQLLISW